jgi:hypothetical protein
MNVTELMKRHRINRVVFLPADDLVPRDRFHAWSLDSGGLDHFMGRGAIVEEAIHDCVRRCQQEAA